MRRRGRQVAILLGAGVLLLAGLLVVEREQVADLLHALRTGYWFEWMPEGVVPGQYGTILNDAGDVAVDTFEEWGTFDRRAGKWSAKEGGLQLLGTLAGRSPPSHSHAINEHGWIIGSISGPPVVGLVPMFQHAFLWTPETGIAELPCLSVRGIIMPSEINDRGEVVGSAAGTSGRQRAFSWEIGSGVRDLGALSEDGESNGVAINDHGWIVGNARDAAEVVGPVLWKPGAGMRSLGAFPGAANSYAQDINNRGEVLVNVEMVGDIRRPVLWREERGYEDIALPSDRGQDVGGVCINDRGEILLSVQEGSAYFLVSGSEVRELPGARRAVRTRYCALNNRGWLAGWAELEEEPRKPSSVRGFLAKPR